MTRESVKFGGKAVSVAGVLTGGGLAIGVPAMVLTLGGGLGAAVQTILIILAMLGGVLLGVVAAFFGTVIPAQVGGHDHTGRSRRHIKVTRDGDRKVVEINGEPVADDAPDQPAGSASRRP